MAEVKYKPMESVSGWIEYPLVTTELDPPLIKLRLRPVNMFNMIDGAAGGGGVKLGRATLEAAVDAVADWDLCVSGVPIPVTAENKMAWLRPIIAEQVEGKPEGILLGIAILMDAQNRENFLKN